MGKLNFQKCLQPDTQQHSYLAKNHADTFNKLQHAIADIDDSGNKLDGPSRVKFFVESFNKRSKLGLQAIAAGNDKVAMKHGKVAESCLISLVPLLNQVINEPYFQEQLKKFEPQNTI